MNTSDVLVETLIEWGVDVVFGLPGDGINGIMEALRARQGRIRFIQVRHEESAAFMACGHAKFTGRLGVCLGTSGPGGLHLLNGLYDAKLDGQPVLAITGHTYHDLIDTFSQQDVDLDRVFDDVAVYNTRVMGPTHIAAVAALACRAALSRGGVAHLNIPLDIQTMTVDNGERSERNVAHHTSHTRGRGVSVPARADLEHAANVLSACSRIAILAGRGALGATDELEQTADLLAAPIITALLGKAAVPDDSPFTTGGLGLLGSRPSPDALEHCDGLLIVGSSFPYIEFLPKPGQARAVQIDVDPERISLRYPVDVALIGDARDTLRELLTLLDANSDRSFLGKAQRGMREWRDTLRERETQMDVPMKPQVVFRHLSDRLSHDAIVSCDSGTSTVWWARHVAVKRGQMHSVSGTLASMGCGLPYAIAAQLAYPDRQCVALVGDGSLSMLMGELATCVRYNLPIRILVLKNNTLGHIKWEQMVFLGNPEYGCDLQPIDFAMVARACGLHAVTAKDPQTVDAVLDEAFRHPGPVLIEAVVDPNEPPMPPRVSLKQAAHFAEALARGTPNRGTIAATVLKDKVRELV
jgi:pyruvate dehydrogenase (quinone)/pyruvate oxidase